MYCNLGRPAGLMTILAPWQLFLPLPRSTKLRISKSGDMEKKKEHVAVTFRFEI